jgi:hypothetical protein
VHVSGLFVEQCKSIHDQEIPVEGLVLLFGANSSGKTTVLEAISDIVGSGVEARFDPADQYSRVIMGVVEFDLPGAGLGREPDTELFRALICGEFGDGTSWKWLDDDPPELLRGATIEDAKAYLVESLVRPGVSGGDDDRLVVAEHAFRSLTFVAAPLSCQIEIDLSRFAESATARAAAERITSMGGHPDDILLRLARSVEIGGTFEFAHVRQPPFSSGSGPSAWTAISSALPVVVHLDAETGSLNLELRNALPRIYNNVWLHAFDPTEIEESGGFRYGPIEPFQMGLKWESDGYQADEWLETLDHEGVENRR